MPASPATVTDFLSLLGKSGLIAQDDLNERLEQLRVQGPIPETPSALAKVLVQEGILTPFHTAQLLAGKSRGFLLGGKYKVLERLGAGGMGAVFLCEHVVMRRLVAVKILPPDQASSPSALERFHREARAVAQLKHPNIVAAHDVDQDAKLHFLVMEFVDGNTLDRIVRKKGQMPLLRACHYIRQAAEGLQHAHEAGLVHRDIKPANLLLGRDGVLKLLDMGLARFFHDSDDNLTRDHDAHSMLGTADYMAPEQAINSTGADIRADIYSLGGTFYFLLAGESPFAGRSTAQKLMMHQLLTPGRLGDVRNDVPREIDDLIGTLLEKDPARRLQTPAEVAAALVPWTETPIPPPDESEMPNWPPAIRALLRTDSPSGTRPATSTALAGVATPTRVQPPAEGAGSENGKSDDPFAEPIPRQKPNGSAAFQSASRVRKRPQTPRPVSAGPATKSPDPALQTAPSERPTAGPTQPRSILLPAPSRSRLLLGLGIGLGVVVLLGVILGTVWLLIPSSPRPQQAVVAKGGEAGEAPAKVVEPVVPVKPPEVRIGEVRELAGHTLAIECVAWTPDGRHLVSTSLDKTMRLWDVTTGKTVEFKGHTGALRGLAVLPDGKRAVTAGVAASDKLPRMWNLETGKEIRRFEGPGHTNGVHWVNCSADGRQLLSSGKDGFIRLWDLDTGKELKAWRAYTDLALTVAFLPDGKRVVSGGSDKDEKEPKAPVKNVVKLWNLQTAEQIDQRKQPGTAWRVDVSPDGQKVAITDKSNIRLWDLQTGEVNVIEVRMQGMNAGVSAAVFSPDGRSLLCGCHDGSVRLMDVATGKELGKFGKHVGPNGAPVNALGVAFSPDGRWAASGGRDNLIRLWQLAPAVAARLE